MLEPFFNTVSRVSSKFPCMSMSSMIFKIFSGTSVRMDGSEIRGATGTGESIGDSVLIPSHSLRKSRAIFVC
jgi:hypothetical protein